MKHFPSLFLILFFLSFFLKAEERQIDKIIATVNDYPITEKEVQTLLEPIALKTQQEYPIGTKEFEEKTARSRKRIIEELINNELIIQEFKKRGGALPQQMIDQEIKKTIRRVYGNDFKSFYENLEKNRISKEKFQENMERRIIVSIAQSSIQRSIQGFVPTHKILEKAYEKHKQNLRDSAKDTVLYERISFKEITERKASILEEEISGELLDAVPPSLSAKEIAQKLRKDPENFSEFAKKYSQDAFASKGGRWPLTRRFDLKEEMSALLFTVPIGKIIGPVEIFGEENILRVIERTITPPPPLEKAKKELASILLREKLAIERKKWIKSIRKKALIFYY